MALSSLGVSLCKNPRKDKTRNVIVPSLEKDYEKQNSRKDGKKCFRKDFEKLLSPSASGAPRISCFHRGQKGGGS